MHNPKKAITTKLTDRGCFEVTSHALNTNGYPVAYLPYYCSDGPKRVRKKQMCIHRYVYMTTHGPITPGLHVLHICDNRRCVNPAHLFLGTHLVNMADKVNKGRQAKGEACGRSKIRQSDVEVIIADDRHTHKELAEQFGVSRSQITKIKGRQTWKHVHVYDSLITQGK